MLLPAVERCCVRLKADQVNNEIPQHLYMLAALKHKVLLLAAHSDHTHPSASREPISNCVGCLPHTGRTHTLAAHTHWPHTHTGRTHTLAAHTLWLHILPSYIFRRDSSYTKDTMSGRSQSTKATSTPNPVSDPQPCYYPIPSEEYGLPEPKKFGLLLWPSSHFVKGQARQRVTRYGQGENNLWSSPMD